MGSETRQGCYHSHVHKRNPRYFPLPQGSPRQRLQYNVQLYRKRFKKKRYRRLQRLIQNPKPLDLSSANHRLDKSFFTL